MPEISLGAQVEDAAAALQSKRDTATAGPMTPSAARRHGSGACALGTNLSARRRRDTATIIWTLHELSARLQLPKQRSRVLGLCATATLLGTRPHGMRPVELAQSAARPVRRTRCPGRSPAVIASAILDLLVQRLMDGCGCGAK